MEKKKIKPVHIFIFPLMPKNCSVCDGINPTCAKYCGDCGCPFPITRIRQRDKSPDNATEPYGRFCIVWRWQIWVVKLELVFLARRIGIAYQLFLKKQGVAHAGCGGIKNDDDGSTDVVS